MLEGKEKLQEEAVVENMLVIMEVEEEVEATKMRKRRTGLSSLSL